MPAELTGIRRSGRLLALIMTAGFIVAIVVAGITTVTAGAAAPRDRTIRIELPFGHADFPPGDGAQLANAHCLICHSAEMVTLQPPLSLEEWTAEINKMRKNYGAAVPAEQTEPLAKYLHRINGR